MPQPNAKGIAGRAKGQRKRVAAKTKRAAPATSKNRKRTQNTAIIDDLFSAPIVRNRN